MAWREDLTGQVFGRFTILRLDPGSKPGKRKWICRCTCGNERSIPGGNLKNGNTSSCGCLRKEVSSERLRRELTTHGQSYTVEYAQYRGMIARCYFPGSGSYKYYGARGIAVCDRWRPPGGWVNFKNDMGPRPSDQHSIERRDTSGNYEPYNCYWATPEEQAQNKRSTVLFTYNGEQMSLRRACRLAGKSYALVLQRVHRGWHISEAFRMDPLPPGERYA
jgi:hypothetical protein